MEQPRNQVVCPRCGEVKLETPPGTVVLPIAGKAEAKSDEGICACGRRRRFSAEHQPGE